MKLILHFERLFEKQSLFLNLEPKIDDDIKLSFLENVQEGVNLANGLPECMRQTGGFTSLWFKLNQLQLCRQFTKV